MYVLLTHSHTHTHTHTHTLKCRPSSWEALYLEFCAPFYFKIIFSSKLFLRREELISILSGYFSSSTVENCTSTQSCWKDKYYETSLERFVARVPFLQDFLSSELRNCETLICYYDLLNKKTLYCRLTSSLLCYICCNVFTMQGFG